ncbi:MAG: hypothetical protein ABIV21_04310 [Pyrinomonadaceae bacterium]
MTETLKVTTESSNVATETLYLTAETLETTTELPGEMTIFLDRSLAMSHLIDPKIVIQ